MISDKTHSPIHVMKMAGANSSTRHMSTRPRIILSGLDRGKDVLISVIIETHRNDVIISCMKSQQTCFSSASGKRRNSRLGETRTGGAVNLNAKTRTNGSGRTQED